jgi:hypothetical protein
VSPPLLLLNEKDKQEATEAATQVQQLAIRDGKDWEHANEALKNLEPPLSLKDPKLDRAYNDASNDSYKAEVTLKQIFDGLSLEQAYSVINQVNPSLAEHNVRLGWVPETGEIWIGSRGSQTEPFRIGDLITTKHPSCLTS